MVVSEHDRISDVLGKAARTDGSANLFVVMDDGAVYSADLVPAECAITATDSPSEPVHQDSEVGMLVTVAAQSEEAVNFAVSLPSRAGELRGTRQLETA